MLKDPNFLVIEGESIDTLKKLKPGPKVLIGALESPQIKPIQID